MASPQPPSTSPTSLQATSAAKPLPQRRIARGQLQLQISNQGRGETYQLLELLPGPVRGLAYSFANLGNPAKLLIRYGQRVILESGFGQAGGSGWLPVPTGASNRVEVIVVSPAPCIETRVNLGGLNAGGGNGSGSGSGLTIADGAGLVAAGRGQRGLLRLPVRLAAAAASTVHVRWRTLAGTASDGRSGDDRADFQASAGVLTFRPGEQERMIEIPIFGDTPITAESDAMLEIFARDFAYSNDFQQEGTDPDRINNSSPYGDLGYRVDRSFQGSDGFQALGLTASEKFYVLISDPDIQGLLPEDSSEGERLLSELRSSLGQKIDDPAYQSAEALVEELSSRQSGWRFATATIHDAGRAPVLAIRGTEPSRELADIWTDLDPGGIGAGQYRNNRQPLLAWLDEVSHPEGLEATLAPHITGHSLGGALAQWLAADPALSTPIGSVVTFNAPGIDRATAFGDHSNLGAVRHYITSTDIVSLAGDALLPGRAVISDVPGSFRNQTPIAGPHLHPVLVPALSNGLQRPAGLVQRSSTAFNMPLFSYLPDPDYLQFLLAVARIPGVGPGLAAALVSRSGVEQARSLIGEELFSAAGRYRLGIATAEAVSRAAAVWSPQAWASISQWSAGAWEAAGRWDQQAWDSTRHWNSEAWIASRLWNDQAWAATARWGTAAWEATSRWGQQAWRSTVQWFNGSAGGSAEIGVRALSAAISADPPDLGFAAPPDLGVKENSLPIPNKPEASSPELTTAESLLALASLSPASSRIALTPSSDPNAAPDPEKVPGAVALSEPGWSEEAWIASTAWPEPVWTAMAEQAGDGSDQLLFGHAGAEALQGGDGDDILDGLGGDDRLIGGAGNDLLIATSGGVELEGGAGSDRYLLNGPGAGLAVISDFEPLQGDQLVLNLHGLVSRDDGAWPALRLGSRAELAEDRLVYERSSGRLILDADGSGPGAGQDLALLLNHADLSDASLDLCQPPEPPPPLPEPAMQPAAVALRLSPWRITAGSLLPGGQVTLETVIETAGGQACRNAQLRLELPPGLSLVSSDAGLLPEAPQEQTIALGPLAAGEQRTVSVQLQLPDGTTAASHTLRAWASGIPAAANHEEPLPALPTGPGTPLASDLASELTLTVQPARQADLEVTSVDDPTAYPLHHGFSSGRIIRNRGTATAENVVISEHLPEALSLESIDGAEFSEQIDGAIRLALGSLEPGDTRIVWLNVSSPVAGVLTSHTEVSSSSNDADPFNNVTSNVFRIEAGSPARTDLQLTLQTSNGAPSVGESLTLRVTLSNEGPGDAAGPLVALPCPEGLELEAIEAERGTYDPSTGLWDVGSLGLGTSTVLQLRARVRQPGLWLATAELVAQADIDRDSDAGNGRVAEDDQATVAIRASSQPVLGVQTIRGPRSVVAEAFGPIAIPLSGCDPWGANRMEGGELALHFDSRALRFQAISQSLRPLAGPPVVEDDLDDRDGNPATDRRLIVRWRDQRRSGSGQPSTTRLLTANFVPMAGLSDTLIGLSSRSTIAGLGFVGDPIAVQRRPWTLDIDGDGQIWSDTDGKLLLLHAFGYEPDPNQIKLMVGDRARRKSPAAIGAYLEEGRRSGALDLDGNGRFEPLTDGVMLLRFMDELAQGDHLTAGALAADATITNSDVITAHLQRLTTLL